MNIQPHLLELAQLRHYFRLPPPGSSEEDEEYTFVKLIMNECVKYGSNWKKAKSGAPATHVGLNDDQKQFIEELARETHPQGKGFFWGQVPKHAEADALVTAYNDGVTDKYKIGILISDRPVCSFCRRSDGLPRLLSLLGIERLTVYDPNCTEGFPVTQRGSGAKV